MKLGRGLSSNFEVLIVSTDAKELAGCDAQSPAECIGGQGLAGWLRWLIYWDEDGQKQPQQISIKASAPRERYLDSFSCAQELLPGHWNISWSIANPMGNGRLHCQFLYVWEMGS
ncbi:patched domain-containing protein 1 [Platysternon megacephalum]|uniref:Patched domain-containing protein 1 n=1 Tax=Platysternon megacephalum TaxID=55544 RepID=A0A4D9EU12_9SAUR|nr:patched domain-containing protein 1 [Platysternon megacephalum]